ncbi:MAG: hypothetical protein ACK4JB_02750 [Reyranella sp.]
MDDLIREHLPYEITMLVRTYDRLIKPLPGDDEFLTSVLIESFCMHARNLLEFFEKGPRNEQELAKTYTRNGYASLHPRKHSKELNQQVSHLIYGGRSTNKEEKIDGRWRFKILETVREELERFKEFVIDPKWITAQWDIPATYVMASHVHSTSSHPTFASVTIDNQSRKPTTNPVRTEVKG